MTKEPYILIPAILLSLIILWTPVFSEEATPTFRVENLTLRKGETKQVQIYLDSIPSGLSKLNASIILTQADIAELGDLNIEAVEDNLAEIAEQSTEKIVFQFVDLRNNLKPGNKSPHLATIAISGVSGGKTNISLTDITLLNEEGTKVQTEASAGTVTVLGKQQTTPSDKSAAKDGQEGEEKPADAYSPSISAKKTLQLGKQVTAPVRIGPLPKGLQRADLKLCASGKPLVFGGAEPTNGLYLEETTDKDSQYSCLSIRIADFEGIIGKSEDPVSVGKVFLKGSLSGKAKVQIQSRCWTEEGEEIQRSVSLGPFEVSSLIVGDSSNAPQDLDRDALYEDVDGNGITNISDAFTLAFNLDTPSVQDQSSLFDFDGDGDVDFEDSAKLASSVTTDKD